MVSSMVIDNHRRREEFRLRLLPLEGIHFQSTISLLLRHSFLVRRAMEVAANTAQILTLPTLSEVLVLRRLGHIYARTILFFNVPVCGSDV